MNSCPISSVALSLETAWRARAPVIAVPLLRQPQQWRPIVSLSAGPDRSLEPVADRVSEVRRRNSDSAGLREGRRASVLLRAAGS
jgi:hypothetical protein